MLDRAHNDMASSLEREERQARDLEEMIEGRRDDSKKLRGKKLPLPRPISRPRGDLWCFS